MPNGNLLQLRPKRVLVENMSATVSNRELGSAPVKEATKILVILEPRGIMTLSLIVKYCSPMVDFARSKTSDKKVNMELEASLQRSKNKIGDVKRHNSLWKHGVSKESKL
jgi:hypothetical protein